MKLSTSVTGFFARHDGSALPPHRRSRHAPALLHRRPIFEPLENRILLSVDLIGIPDWVEQGPGPTVTGSSFIQVGAIEAVVATPGNADRVFVGAVNGGVWRTDNATAASPSWTPLTDDFPSLSISALALSQLDNTFDTLYAATGRRSSGAFTGGLEGRIMLTTDGGDTWSLLGDDLFGKEIRSIVPTAIGTGVGDQVVLVATPDGGVYRSADGAQTFAQVSGSSGASDGIDNDADGMTDEPGELNLPSGGATHLVSDPGDSNRLYAAIPSQGIYRSDDGGSSWRQVNGTGVANINAALPGVRVELSVHDSGADNVVYAAVLQNNVPPATTFTQRVVGLFRSLDQGDTWRAVQNLPQIPQNGQAAWHFSFVAHPTDPDVLFIRGDVGDGYRVTMDDAMPANDAWALMQGAGANGTSPHADSRDMTFDANGDLLQADDGGLYRLVDPDNAGTRVWESVNGNIRPTEFYGITYDALNGTIFGGTQDNGTARQRDPGDALYPFTWDVVQGGDGGITLASTDGVTSTQYTSSQNLGGFTRRTVDATNTETGFVGVGLVVDDATNDPGTVAANTIFGVEGALPGGSTIQFIQPYALNEIDFDRILIGTNFLYESFNGGDNLTALGDLMDLNGDGLNNDNDFSDPPANTMPLIDEGDEFRPLNPVGKVGAMVYGGRQGGIDNADVTYVGTSGGTVNGTFGRLFLRTADTTGSLADFSALTAYTGGAPRDIVLDPDDWATAYVIDADEVFATFDAGLSWDNITENLGAVTSDLRSVELVTGGSGDMLLVGSLMGVFRSEVGPSVTARWTEFGTGLPNALLRDLQFDAGDDILVAGSWGRGAWTIPDVSLSIFTPGQLVIDGELLPDQDDDIRLVRREANTLLLDVYMDGAVVLSVEFAALESIAVNGLGGSDELTLDFEFGDVIPFDGVAYDGGIELGTSDQLTLENGSFTTVTYTATGPGAGTVDLDGDVVTYVFLDPILDTTTATNRVFTDATGLDQTIEVENAGGGLTRIDDGGTSAFESVTFAPPTGSLTVNAGDGNDDIFVDFASGTNVVNVNGGSGDDSLQVNGTAAADSIMVTATQVTRGTETVAYQQIEDLAVTGGAGEDELLVLSTSTAGARLDAEEDSDDYTVNFGSLAGAVQVDDSGPLLDFDTLLVNGTMGMDVLVLSAGLITRDTETVSYAGIEDLTIDAQGGDDTITVEGTDVTTLILGGDGDDYFTVNATGPFTLTLDGEEGSDTYEIHIGALAGLVEIDDTGTVGTDTLVVFGTPGDDEIFLTDVSITGLGDGSPFNVTFDGIEVLEVHALAGDDLVDGSELTMSVTIFGGDGDDLLIGGSNNDQIFGEGDNDDIIGNLGSDYLDGGEGSDGILGDMGTIERELVAGGLALLTTQNGKLEANVNRPGTIRRKVTLDNEGEGGDDTLIGGEGDDYLHGGEGDDDLSGDGGIDALFGNDGNDMLAGGADDDHLYGGAGDDELDGNAGADIAYGGDGEDRLIADSSGDRLIDWFGNFNEFVVPGPGFGAPVIVRAPAPWAMSFLLALAADDGATDAEGELGFVKPGGSAQQANSGKGG